MLEFRPGLGVWAIRVRGCPIAPTQSACLCAPSQSPSSLSFPADFQGPSQWVMLQFPQRVRVSQLCIQFQGGFSSRRGRLEGTEGGLRGCDSLGAPRLTRSPPPTLGRFSGKRGAGEDFGLLS